MKHSRIRILEETNLEGLLLNKNDKLDKFLQGRLKSLEALLGAQGITCLVTNSMDKNVICKNGSDTKIHDQYRKLMLELATNAEAGVTKRIVQADGVCVDGFYEMEHNSFYLIRLVHMQQGESIQSANIGIQYMEGIDIGRIGVNQHTIRQLLDDMTARIELFFLKSDNYSRMYKLLDVFEELSSLKSTRLPYHMNNVASWSLELAREMNLHEVDMLNLYFAALAHDIGLIYTDQHIMNKGDALSVEEYRQIKGHSERGEQLFQLCVLGIPTLTDIPKYIRHHHERWDGVGYPDMLAGEEIPKLSQIIGVADAVDSMLSERLFTTPKTINEVREELEKQAGVQFSPEVVQHMLKILSYTKVNVDHNFVFNDIMVIHNVAVCVQFNERGRIVNQQGNLMINGKNVRITLNHCDNLELDKIHSIKMAFFDRKKIYEFHVTASESVKNTIFVDEMSQVPGDRLFSLYWDIDVEMEHVRGITALKALRVGGEGLAFVMNNRGKEKDVEAKNDIVRMIGKPIPLKLHFVLEDEEDVIQVEAIVTGYYISGEKSIFILKYVNPPHEIVDRIVRLLFRKQMHGRRFHKKGNENVDESVIERGTVKQK